MPVEVKLLMLSALCVAASLFAAMYVPYRYRRVAERCAAAFSVLAFVFAAYAIVAL